MNNYYAGFTVSTFLHLSLILSFTNFYKIDFDLFSIEVQKTIPAYIIYEQPTVEKKKPSVINIQERTVREKDKEKSLVDVKVSSPKTLISELDNIINEAKKEDANNNVDQVAFFTNKIRTQIVSKWNQPPSAKNGLKVELNLTLVPTGEIVDIQITKGSGNEAFDRSALLAVHKVGRFNDLVMPRKLFDIYFRNFTLIFFPQE